MHLLSIDDVDIGPPGHQVLRRSLPIFLFNDLKNPSSNNIVLISIIIYRIINFLCQYLEILLKNAFFLCTGAMFQFSLITNGYLTYRSFHESNAQKLHIDASYCTKNR